MGKKDKASKVTLGNSTSTLTGLLVSQITERNEKGEITSEREEYSYLLDAHIRQIIREELARFASQVVEFNSTSN